MNFQRALKMASYVVSALVFLAITGPMASAYTFVTSTVYDASGLCVRGKVGIDHYTPGSFSANLAYDETFALTQGCSTGLVLPNGWAAARLDVYKWTGTQWGICKGTNWQYGPTGISGGDTGGPYGPQQVLDYGYYSALCGPGYYGTMAFAYAWDGSAWRGGSVWSGYELAP